MTWLFDQPVTVGAGDDPYISFVPGPDTKAWVGGGPSASQVMNCSSSVAGSEWGIYEGSASITPTPAVPETGTVLGPA